MAEKHSSISDRIKCFVLHWVLILVTGNLANVPTSLEKEKNRKFGNGIQIKNLILKNIDNNNSQTHHSTSLDFLILSQRNKNYCKNLFGKNWHQFLRKNGYFRRFIFNISDGNTCADITPKYFSLESVCQRNRDKNANCGSYLRVGTSHLKESEDR